MTIHTDGKQTIANRPLRDDENWLTRLERELYELDRERRERVYWPEPICAACREQQTCNTFDWLACLEGALDGTS